MSLRHCNSIYDVVNEITTSSFNLLHDNSIKTLQMSLQYRNLIYDVVNEFTTS